jgi:phosphoribosyl 1,2-cyclic phosphate phosphodiesterase
MHKGKFTFLGTGGSMGIPVIGCPCATCHSDSPYNSRFRSSGLLQIHNKSIIIDCGPDFRMQALRSHVDKLDGLIITHSHNDHTGGVDDLRAYGLFSNKSIPCLLSPYTLSDLRHRFPYIFPEGGVQQTLVTQFDLRVLEGNRGSVRFLDLLFRYMTFEQAGMLVNGFKIGNFAYISDIKNYPDSIFEDLQGVELLVLSALRFSTSHLHFSIDDAIDFSRNVGAARTWLTHISHDLDHEKTNVYLPVNIRMAYDGLEIEFAYDPFAIE